MFSVVLLRGHQQVQKMPCRQYVCSPGVGMQGNLLVGPGRLQEPSATHRVRVKRHTPPHVARSHLQVKVTGRESGELAGDVQIS